jgi:hypothetical protein
VVDILSSIFKDVVDSDGFAAAVAAIGAEEPTAHYRQMCSPLEDADVAAMAAAAAAAADGVGPHALEDEKAAAPTVYDGRADPTFLSLVEEAFENIFFGLCAGADDDGVDLMSRTRLIVPE